MDVSKNMGIETVEQSCEEHGQFQAKAITTYSGMVRYSQCPKCAEAETRAEQARIKQREDEQRKDAIERAMLFTERHIPMRYRGKNINSFETTTPAQKKAKESAHQYIKNAHKAYENGAGLILCGSTGVGKTHLACAIAMGFSAHGYITRYALISDCMREIKATYNKDHSQSESEVLKGFTQPQLLVLDEVGLNSNTDHEKQLLFEIINKRYEIMRPTVLVSNLSPKALSESLGERILDRMRENGGKMIVCEGVSYRASNV